MRMRLAAIEVDEKQLSHTIKSLCLVHNKYGKEWYERVPAVLEGAARLLLEPKCELRAQAIALAETIGMSSPMVDEAMRNLLPQLTRERLQRLRREQLGAKARRNRILPRLIFHNLAGNLFLSGWESLVLANLTGACNLVRTAQHDPFFPMLFVKAMSMVDPLAEQMNKVVWWPHTATSLTEQAAGAADVVVAFGDDVSVASLRGLTPVSTRFIAHGHKLSFALVDGEELPSARLTRLVNALAYDFSVYDQQGCLSPRALFVRTRSQRLINELGQKLSEAMAQLARLLPRHTLSLEESTAIAREREEALIQFAAYKSGTARHDVDRTARVFSPMDGDYLVMARSLVPFQVGPVNRTVIIRPFQSLEQLHNVLAPYRGHISTLGLDRFREEWLELAHNLGVGRLCPLGKMQKPPLGWTHDGYQPLAALTTPIELRELR